MRITITNNFTNRSTTVNTTLKLTPSRIRNIRQRLCSDECRSGDVLGARGKQVPEYDAFVDRANFVILTGISEK